MTSILEGPEGFTFTRHLPYSKGVRAHKGDIPLGLPEGTKASFLMGTSLREGLGIRAIASFGSKYPRGGPFQVRYRI
jgi:hypothetical protein